MKKISVFEKESYKLRNKEERKKERKNFYVSGKIERENSQKVFN